MSWALAAVGVGLQIYGGIEQAKALEAQATAGAAGLRAGAEQDRANALLTGAATKAQAKRARREGDTFLSTQRAIAGGTGIRMQAYNVLFDQTTVDNELDALAIELEGRAQVFNFEQSARIKEEQAGLTEEAGEEAQKAVAISTASNITEAVQ